MATGKIQVIIGYDPDLAGDGFTVNGAASFDIYSALSLTLDLLKHQGAPITKAHISDVRKLLDKHYETLKQRDPR